MTTLLIIACSLLSVSLLFNYLSFDYAKDIKNDYKKLYESYNNLYKEYNELLEDSESNEIINMIEDFRKQMEERNKKAKQRMAEMFDEREKKIGDRVKIWDYSFAILDNGEQAFHIFSSEDESKKQKLRDFTNIEAIIVETNCMKEAIVEFAGQKINKNCDLCIEFPDKTRIYTTSNSVRRTDEFEK